MAKLYFRYGTVGSAKTLNLLAVAHSYTQQCKRVILLKPELDDRFGKQRIASRCGLEKDADLLIGPDTILEELLDFRGVDCILVDEVQFVSPNIIDQLRSLATHRNVPIICYGLRSDFRRSLFAASAKLMELADQIEEIKMTCAFCNRKAIFNMKLVNGVPTLQGPSIELGCEEKYLPACSHCYDDRLGKSPSSRRSPASEYRANHIQA